VFESLVTRRVQREPLAYITGRREFYGIEFECTRAALIPRPETELLVDLALAEIQERGAGLSVVDVGTGSGAIAVSIATGSLGTHVVATDASSKALALALRNAKGAGVADRVEFVHCDLLAAMGAFDLVVANLPYVSEGEWQALAPELREWEPRNALVGGKRGTEVIERLLEQAAAHLRPGGVLGLEIGDTQGVCLTALARGCFPEGDIHVRTDLAGLDRMLVVRT
jgi:release factor glutamine methyltransferase